MSESFEGIFLCFAVITLVGIIVLLLTHLYRIFEEPTIQKRMRTLRKSAQPWVTILVYARNDDATIEASLRSLSNMHYGKYDIVVIDDCSHDATTKRTREFIATHTKVPIQILRRRTRRTLKEALKAGYRKSRHGVIVVSLSADIIVKPFFLKRIIAIKGERQQVSVSMTTPASARSLTDIVQTLNTLLWRQTHLVRASNAQNIFLTRRRVRFDILTVLVFMAIVVMSVLAQETIIFWYTWILVTGYICAAIWLEEEKISQKVALTFSALPAFFLLPVASLFASILRLRARN